MRIVLLLALLLAAGAEDEHRVTVRGPLPTLVRGPEMPGTAVEALEVGIDVPADAPADLGIGVWATDRHGLWFQAVQPGRLVPGRHRLSLALGASARLNGERHGAAWDPVQSGRLHRAGLLLFTADPRGCTLRLSGLRLRPAPPPDRPTRFALADLEIPQSTARTGERWVVRVRPQPVPAHPDDPSAFALDAVFTGPDGAQERIAGFHRQPMQLADRGDIETATPSAPAWCEVRWRPRRPGIWQVRLIGSWDGVERVVCDLPPLTVAGEAWDGYVRVDAGDPRFFATGTPGPTAGFYYLVGSNLRSVYDVRSHDNAAMATRLTPDRGTLAYAAYLDRLAAAGGTGIEVWMSAWNLAFEWTAAWPGFHGRGAYAPGNAERLDHLLDLCWSRGIRVNLVINNHGQVSRKNDREWPENPWNRANGGPLADAGEFFTHPQALAGAEHLRRHLAARCADHPAVLGWKLFSEVNLTAVDRALLPAWCEAAAASWRRCDPYGHPVSIHWSGDWKTPDRAVCAVRGLDYLCIDAYRKAPKGTAVGDDLARLLWDGLQHPDNSLARFGKPVLVTEYGGSWQGAEPWLLDNDLRTGPWLGLVAGYPGTPMLWWHEWIDQNGRWPAFAGFVRFLAGEDLRSRPGSPARGVLLACAGDDGPRWAAAWSRPGRLLGYLLDPRSGASAAPCPARAAQVTIGEAVTAGTMTVEWWDADVGSVIDRAAIIHPGGPLVLRSPAFVRHAAFKLCRGP